MRKLSSGQEKAVQKSKYEEDVYINNHTVSHSNLFNYLKKCNLAVKYLYSN